MLGNLVGRRKEFMKPATIQKAFTGLARIKLFLALSRTPHVLLDMATPALSALLWLGAFPPLHTVILGIITAFAGYTAVYALNDLMDHSTDRLKLREGELRKDVHYLDAVLVRHPIALGLLGVREGLFWAAAWCLLALVGAYILNPVCALIFLAGSLLEAVYCVLRKVSSFRIILSGAVKTSGAMAAVIAVDHDPSPAFLITLFLWVFLWEIGGQNIPADWADIKGDDRNRSRTVPVLLGPAAAKAIILACLCAAVIMNLIVFRLTPKGGALYDGAAFLLIGVYLLILPAYRLFKSNNRLNALNLFNRASYYPLALLVVVAVRSML